MIQIKISILILIVFIFSSIQSSAQEPPDDLGYEPPEGWEYVMDLDSASSFNIYCHDDSCFLTVSFAGNRKYLHHLSTNGGDSWERIEELPSPRQFIINTMNLHRIHYNKEDGYTYYQKTTDFYKTSEDHKITKTFYWEDTLYQSPIDPDLLIARFKYEEEIIQIEYLSRDNFTMISRDGGKTWEEMTNLYRMPNYKTQYSFYFDWAEKGHWFVKAVDGEDIYEVNKAQAPEVYLETIDNGKTFREIEFDPDVDYLGLDGKKTYRDFKFDAYKWYDSSINKVFTKYYTCRGIEFVSYDSTIQYSDFFNWLSLIDANNPMTNLDSGYIFTLDQHRIETFQFDYNKYSNIVISADEMWGVDLQNRKVEGNKEYLAQSTNNGKTWEILNIFKNRPRIRNLFIDQKKKILWIHTIDEPFSFGNSGYKKGSLCKLHLNWSSTNIKNQANRDSLLVFPNPARDEINIILPKESDIYNIEMVNLFGKSVLSKKATNQQTGINSIDLTSIPSGAYFMRVSSGNNIYVKKLTILK